MGRVAGDAPGYTLAVCRAVEVAGSGKSAKDILEGGKQKSYKLYPTETTFQLPSATTILGEVLAKPPSAMAWWGFRDGLKGLAEAAAAGEPIDLLDAEGLEELLKARGVSPNMTRDAAGTRGSNAHEVLEILARGDFSEAEKWAREEEAEEGTGYCRSAIVFWESEVVPHLDSGAIDEVRSEVVVVSFRHFYSGTLDLALHWSEVAVEMGLVAEPGWTIEDAKTHKPAQGFTKRGAGYVSDAAQCRAYRTAWEENGHGKTIGQRTIVLRDREYKGVRYLCDSREVSEEFWLGIRALYEPRLAYEKGDG